VHLFSIYCCDAEAKIKSGSESGSRDLAVIFFLPQGAQSHCAKDTMLISRYKTGSGLVPPKNLKQTLKERADGKGAIAGAMYYCGGGVSKNIFETRYQQGKNYA